MAIGCGVVLLYMAIVKSLRNSSFKSIRPISKNFVKMFLGDFLSDSFSNVNWSKNMTIRGEAVLSYMAIVKT